MTNLNEILRSNKTRTEAIMAVRAEAIEEIDKVLGEMDYCDTYDILHEINDDFHSMDDLDDTFDYMTVTEILEQLRHIDLADDYFDADSKRSGNDPWDIADVNRWELATQFYDDETSIEPTDEIIDVLREAEYLVDDINSYFKRFDTAKALFEQAMSQDPDAVINTLWNINNN